MTRKKLTDMTVEELVERFAVIALAQSEAIEKDENTKYNRLFDEMNRVEAELKQRSGDQRRMLLPLLEHPNAQVRVKAAIRSLGVNREAALGALQKISDRNEYPQAADARGMIEAVADGTYIPE